MPDVGWTALLTAYGRAQEARESRPLFHDALAAEFITAYSGTRIDDNGALPDMGPATDRSEALLWNGFKAYFTSRTPFYDRVVTTTAGTCPQIVMLGAGLDSRAFRLGLHGARTVFEIDRPAVLDFKQDVLDRVGAQPTCRRVPVAADLAREDLATALGKAGFDSEAPALWVAEGLFMYLSADEADRLLDDMRSLSAPGSRLAGEYFSHPWRDANVEYDRLPAADQAIWRQLKNSFVYGPAAHLPADWLAAHGWRSEQVTDVATMLRASGREVPYALGAPDTVRIWLFEAMVPATAVR
jgi:methyltransferase (TIGR00027 family)